jgi:restriction system protein
MLSRFELLRRPPFPIITAAGPVKSSRRRYLHGWLLLGILTAVFVAWLVYRLWSQPTWPDVFPLVAELLELVEAAGAFTLTFLWVGLWWRRRRLIHFAPVKQLNVETLYQLSPKDFERYVGALFQQKGYRVVLRGRSGDHGVDLELFGPDGRRAIVQCKRYQNTVGEETVRELFGTLIHERAMRAFLVTTAEISEAAERWARGKPITLIDGRTLVEIAHSLKTTTN